jgi:hypothetical protein
MTDAALSLDTIDRLTGGRLGTHNVPCPLCGPYKSTHGQRRKVLRVWRIESGFAGYHCARCGEKGHVRDQHAPEPDPVKLAQARAEAAERDRIHKADRLGKARWLWSQRLHPQGTIVATYLQRRSINCPIPGTIGFLPASRDYAPAMITAFGMPHETGDGIAIRDDAVRGVHLTRLLPDGSDRERTAEGKIIIGHSIGSPLVLAQAVARSPRANPSGLCICEGIEDGLTLVDCISGVGAWAAGGASRLPALADAIPSYVECVTVMIDDDADGWRHSTTLINRIRARRIEARQIVPNRWRPTSLAATSTETEK